MYAYFNFSPGKKLIYFYTSGDDRCTRASASSLLQLCRRYLNSGRHRENCALKNQSLFSETCWITGNRKYSNIYVNASPTHSGNIPNCNAQ